MCLTRPVSYVFVDRGCGGRVSGPEVGYTGAGPIDQCDARYGEVGEDAHTW